MLQYSANISAIHVSAPTSESVKSSEVDPGFDTKDLAGDIADDPRRVVLTLKEQIGPHRHELVVRAFVCFPA